jgi:hypothetical protein
MRYALDLPCVNATLWGRHTRDDLLVEEALKQLRRYRINKTIERFNTEYFEMLLTKPSLTNRIRFVVPQN